jgi:hypothetical protein
VYDTHEEATQKLGSTIVLFQGKPTYVIGGTGSKAKVSLKHYLVREDKEMSNPITDTNWEFRNLGSRLGYMNTRYSMGKDNKEHYKEALFVSRVAVRASHATQGLSSRNLKYGQLKGSSTIGVPPQYIEWDTLRSLPSFCDTLEGIFPAFSDITKQFSTDALASSLAFHKNFAIRKHDIGPFYLEYKGKDVGYTEDFNRWKFAEQYKYLQETLDDLKIQLKM